LKNRPTKKGGGKGVHQNTLKSHRRSRKENIVTRATPPAKRKKRGPVESRAQLRRTSKNGYKTALTVRRTGRRKNSRPGKRRENPDSVDDNAKGIICLEKKQTRLKKVESMGE